MIERKSPDKQADTPLGRALSLGNSTFPAFFLQRSSIELTGTAHAASERAVVLPIRTEYIRPKHFRNLWRGGGGRSGRSGGPWQSRPRVVV